MEREMNDSKEIIKISNESKNQKGKKLSELIGKPVIKSKEPTYSKPFDSLLVPFKVTNDGVFCIRGYFNKEQHNLDICIYEDENEFFDLTSLKDEALSLQKNLGLNVESGHLDWFVDAYKQSLKILEREEYLPRKLKLNKITKEFKNDK